MAGTPLHSWYGFSTGLPQYTTIDANGNVSANYATFTNLTATVAQFSTANANNFNVTGNLNVTGNIVGNIVGKLQSPGADTWVLYTIGGNANSSANFTFNPATNFLHVSAGNLCVDDGRTIGSMYGSTAGNVLTVTSVLTTGLSVGSTVIGPGVLPGTTILASGSGNGGPGTYWLSSNVAANYSNTTFNFQSSNGYSPTSGQIIGKWFWGDGSNITNVAARTANTVLASSQPNITSVGNLVSLSVSNVSNVSIPGGTSGQVLISTGNGGVAWSNIASISGGISNGTSNINISTMSGPVTISANGIPNIVVVNGPNAINNYPNVVINGELWVNGNVRANYFDGDGGRLANINSANINGNLTLSGSFGVVRRSNIAPIIIDRGEFIVMIRHPGNPANLAPIPIIA